MLGHSSLQMIFQRYYAWIPKHTRSDGQAFMRYVESATSEVAKDDQRAEQKQTDSDQRCTNLVPLDEYRRKKRA
jgi:integrase